MPEINDRMADINDRMAEALSALGKRQANVARDLGISTAAVSQMLTGKTRPSGQTISMFCSQYGVRREWLETGAGEMMEDKSREEKIADYTARMIRSDNRFQMALIDVILSRTPEELAVIEKAFDDLAERMHAHGHDSEREWTIGDMQYIIEEPQEWGMERRARRDRREQMER